uniref:Predicted protein n=1 Tax=Hordeum vulgare subsp. vulgare TaxID=112509 RepID=F2D987_HORVV|nr:predicted protein [Hordeum vulgare subsp. vulgare]
MAPSSTNRGRRRVVLLPLPYQGHINPMLRLAAALHSRGLAVTILHPETRAPDRRKLPADYRLVTIPDNIPPELAASEDIASFVFALNKNCAAPFRDYLAGALREEEEGEDGRLAFVVADVDWFAPLSVARELGVAALALMTTSAARFLVYLAYPSLCQKGYLPVQGNAKSPLLCSWFGVWRSSCPCFQFVKRNKFIFDGYPPKILVSIEMRTLCIT